MYLLTGLFTIWLLSDVNAGQIKDKGYLIQLHIYIDICDSCFSHFIITKFSISKFQFQFEYIIVLFINSEVIVMHGDQSDKTIAEYFVKDFKCSFLVVLQFLVFSCCAVVKH